MAKFVPILGNLSGSIGANTFSNNRGGPYVKRRPFPTNPTSTRQQIARTILATLSKAWQTLTAEQKSSWNSWATTHPEQGTLGEKINLTGHQMFIALNSRRLDFGLAFSATPPTDDAPAALTTASIVRTTATTSTLTWTPTPLGTGLRIQLWQCLPTAGDQNPVFSQARLSGYSAAAATSPVVFTNAAAWQVGETCVWYAAVVSTSGQVSPPLRMKVTA